MFCKYPYLAGFCPNCHHSWLLWARAHAVDCPSMQHHPAGNTHTHGHTHDEGNHLISCALGNDMLSCIPHNRMHPHAFKTCVKNYKQVMQVRTHQTCILTAPLPQHRCSETARARQQPVNPAQVIGRFASQATPPLTSCWPTRAHAPGHDMVWNPTVMHPRQLLTCTLTT